MRDTSVKKIIISKTSDGDVNLSFPTPLLFNLFLEYFKNSEMEEHLDAHKKKVLTLDNYYDCKSVSETSTVTIKGCINLSRCLTKFFLETNLPFESTTNVATIFRNADINKTEIDIGNGMTLKVPQFIINKLHEQRVETSDQNSKKDPIKNINISEPSGGYLNLNFPAPFFFELFLKYINNTMMEEFGDSVITETLDNYYDCKSDSKTSTVKMKSSMGVTGCLEKFFWETNLPYLSRIELDPKTFQNADANEIKLSGSQTLKAPQSIISILRENRVKTSDQNSKNVSLESNVTCT